MLVIYTFPDFLVNGCEIGLKSSLEMLLLIGNLTILSLIITT